MPRQFFFTGTLFSFVFFSTFALAQSAENKQSSSSNSPQNSSASSSQKAGSDPAPKPPEKKKSKKVWTNEEVGSLNGTVSVVGDPAAATAGGGTSAGSRAAAGSGDAESYRRQLSPLRGDLAELDRQIREVKSRGAQGASYNHSSLDKLEDRRKSLQLKIDAIEEDARRHGIAPGDVR